MAHNVVALFQRRLVVLVGEAVGEKTHNGLVAHVGIVVRLLQHAYAPIEVGAEAVGEIVGGGNVAARHKRLVAHQHTVLEIVGTELSADDFKHGMLVCHQAFVARRDIAPAYNLAYRFSADFDWCIRVLQQSDHNAYVGDKPIVSFLTDGLTDKHHKASLKERYHIMCHYYGTASTLLRHVGFAFRALLRKCK